MIITLPTNHNDLQIFTYDYLYQNTTTLVTRSYNGSVKELIKADNYGQDGSFQYSFVGGVVFVNGSGSLTNQKFVDFKGHKLCDFEIPIIQTLLIIYGNNVDIQAH